MPKALNAEQIARYERDGGITPVPIMSREDAKVLRLRFDGLKSGIDGELRSRIGFAVHIAAPEVRQAQFDGATAVVVRGSDRFCPWKGEHTPRGDKDPDCLAALDRAWDQYRRAMKAPFEQ